MVKKFFSNVIDKCIIIYGYDYSEVIEIVLSIK